MQLALVYGVGRRSWDGRSSRGFSIRLLKGRQFSLTSVDVIESEEKSVARFKCFNQKTEDKNQSLTKAIPVAEKVGWT